MSGVPTDPFDRAALEQHAQELARELWGARRQRSEHLRAAEADVALHEGVGRERAGVWSEFDRLRDRLVTLGMNDDTTPAQCVDLVAGALEQARARAAHAAANLDVNAAAIAEHTGIYPREAAFVSQAVPATMTAGRPYGVSIRMRNTGSETWTPEANYRLGSQNPQDNLTWGLSRIGVPGPVAPRQEVDFSFAVTAPSLPGSLSYPVGLQWRMLQEAVAWFGSYSPNVDVRVQRPVAELASARLLDGRLELWAADTDGAQFGTRKTTTHPDATWTPWEGFFGLPGGARQLAVAPLTDGRLEQWAVDGGGGLWTSWHAITNSNSPWTSWSSFYDEVGGLPGGARHVAVAPLSDGRLELWASAGDGRLYTTWKLDGDPNAAWAPWYDFYGDVGDLPGGAGELAVVQLMDRRLILWAIAGNGVIYASWKTSDDPNAGWSPWSDFYGEVGGLAGGARSLAVAPLTDGRLELWATDGNGALLTTWQAVRDPNSSWVGWNDFGASAGWLAGGARAVAVGPLSDGRLELWATDAYGSLLSSWKVTTDPNAGWTPWTEFVL